MEEKDIWEGDLLGRKEDADFLIKFLKGRYEERKKASIKSAYVLNIDAEWGFGKSFFMERVAEQLRGDHPVVFIDAWKNDFSDDPYTMVLSEIDGFLAQNIVSYPSDKPSKTQKFLTVLKAHAGRIAYAGLKGAVTQLGRRYAGDAIENVRAVIDEVNKDGSQNAKIAQEISDAGLLKLGDELAKIPEKILDDLSQRAIDTYQAVKLSQNQFRITLGELLSTFDSESTLNLPMFIFIDELDRCRPPYAIALLERIKHLFDVDGIVFVVSTDTQQLSHSINGVYGPRF